MNASSTKEIHKNGSIKKTNLVTKHVKEFKEKVKNEDVKEKENNNDNIGAKEVKDKQVKEKQNNKPAVNNNKTEASNLTWYTGTCKWFNNTKGWGFVNLTVAEDVTNSGEGEDDLPLTQPRKEATAPTQAEQLPPQAEQEPALLKHGTIVRIIAKTKKSKPCGTTTKRLL